MRRRANSWKWERILAFSFGAAVFCVVAYASIREQSIDPQQHQLLRILTAIAAAGIASVVPGYLNVQLSTKRFVALRAGGALAVFVVVYFFSPPPPPTSEWVGNERSQALSSVTNLLAVLRAQTEWVLTDYPEAYDSRAAMGQTSHEIKEEILGEIKQRIDTEGKCEQVGTSLRLLFRDRSTEEWSQFLQEGKKQFLEFMNAVHEAAASGTYDQRAPELRRMRLEYLGRWEELRDRYATEVPG